MKLSSDIRLSVRSRDSDHDNERISHQSMPQQAKDTPRLSERSRGREFLMDENEDEDYHAQESRLP